MTAWRGDLVPNQSVIRIIDNVDEFRRLCERRAPGADRFVDWVEDMEDLAGEEFTVEDIDETKKKKKQLKKLKRLRRKQQKKLKKKLKKLRRKQQRKLKRLRRKQQRKLKKKLKKLRRKQQRKLRIKKNLILIFHHCLKTKFKNLKKIM